MNVFIHSYGEYRETKKESVTTKESNDIKRMIMLDGELYVETGEKITVARCGNLDGYIKSVIDPMKTPKKNGQANFGSKDIGYQTVANSCIDVNINGNWLRFEPENKDKMLKSLNVEIVEKVIITVMPQNATLKLKDKEIKQLIKILKNAKLIEKDDSYAEFNGQLIDITIKKIDGTQMSIKEINPFIVVNDVGYKAKYEFCKEIDDFVDNIIKN